MKKSCLVAILIVVAGVVFLVLAIKRGLTPRDLAREEAGQVFETFVCSPIPQSVRNIKARGTIALASGSAEIEFQLDPRDREDLLERGKFKLMGDRAPQWVKEFQPLGADGSLIRYVRANQGMTQSALFMTEDLRKAWFREIQF